MKIRIFFTLLCLIAANVNARQVITGVITDKETTKPVETASVELLQLPDSVLAEASMTNSEGSFMLYKADTAKTYCLRIKCYSYKKLVLPVPKKTGSMINNLGIIVLEPSVLTIKEVVVNGSRVRVTELADRTIYGIPADMKKTSTDGLDVLRKIPSVQVDYFNENVTVEGKSNIKIEVDGVPRDKDYLKKLHPSQVDKLEIITNPSGKYDAEVDAVINVVTIREMRYGLKGTVNAQGMLKSRDTYMGRFNGSLDYGMKKISYYVAANGGVDDFGFVNIMERYTDTTKLQRNGTTHTKGYQENITTGLIYDPDEFNNLNLNLSYKNSKYISDGDQFNYNSENSIVNNIFETTSSADNRGGGLNSSLFYKHKFDKTTQHSYEIEASYYNSLNNKNTTTYQNISYAPDTTELSSTLPNTEESKTDTKTINTRANYTLPFDSVYTFNTGIGGNYNQNGVTNTRYLSNAPNLDYKELRGSFFAEISKTLKKGSIKVGTRIEASHVTINSTSENDYISMLPYTNGQYKINDKSSIKLNYSRRVIRPSSGQLNPFESEADSPTISHGNINLKPAYRDNFQLTYNIKYGKGKFSGNISPQMFYEYKTKLIQKVTRFNEVKNKYENVPENISNGYETGIGISLNSQIFNLMLNSNFRYSYNHIDSYLNQIDATNKKSWNWNSYVVCPLPFNFRIFSVLNLNGPFVNGQEQTKSKPFYLFGIVKQFKNNSNVNVLFFNPLAKRFFDNISTLNTSSFYQRSETYMHLKNAIMVTYSYNFKIGKAINLQKRGNDQGSEDNGFKLPF